MTIEIVALSGSPSPTSKTAALVDHVLGALQEQGIRGSHVRLASLRPEALIRGEIQEPEIAEAIARVEAAKGVIIATPIFKASFSGVLKVFLDLLPQYGLAGKAVLPLGTGGSPAHILALDYGLRPVLQSMGARHIVQATFVGASQMESKDGRVVLDPDCRTFLDEAVLHFGYSLRNTDLPLLLGHPRPARAA